MQQLRWPIVWLLIPLLLAAGCVDVAGRPLDWAEMRAAATCPVTLPNGETPPGEQAFAAYYGNGTLWTALWPGGVVYIPRQNVEPDGRLGMKWPWWRGAPGPFTITGQRLDAPAAPLTAHIPAGYGETGFQATGLVFARPGCWEVTGQVGEASLSFITFVVVGDPPAQ